MSSTTPSHIDGKRIAKRYDVRALLGRGGMGAVYRARDIKADREVALKLIRPEFSSDPKTRRRFNKEARAFAYLKHRNIVEVYDFGQDDDGTLYLSMELVQGTSLRALSKAVLPLSAIMSIVDQLLAALAHAHARGVIHRDLKPENVLVAQNPDTLDPIIKLVDFGLASLPAMATTGTHQTGTVIGTPSYMAPEQARGSRGVVGPGTDIYAIGVMLYELLCGQLPYQADGGIELILKHVQQPIPPLRPRADLVVPPELAQAVNRAMAKKPWDRFVNAADFRRALQRIAVEREPMPRIVVRTKPRKNDDTPAIPQRVVEVPPAAEVEANQANTAVISNELLIDSGPPAPIESSSDAGTDASPRVTPTRGTSFDSRPRSSPRIVEAIPGHTIPTPPVRETHISSVSFSLATGDLIGRESESERVRAICERALGGQGQVVVIEGEAGIGKSRLARSIVHRFTETGLMRAAVGMYTATEGGGTNVGLRGAIESVFGTTDMDRSSMNAQTRGVLERLGINDRHDRSELVEYLRGAEDLRSDPDLAEGAVRRQRSRLALLQRTSRLIAQEMPLIVLLEDIQWATDGLPAFLESMASSFRLHATPCVIICTVAREESGPGTPIGDALTHLVRFEGVHRVTLGRLTDEQVLRLIQQQLRLEPELADILTQRAGGNPFYALHFLQALRQDNSLVRDEAAKTWNLRDDVTIETALPASIADVLRARILRTRARLAPEQTDSFYEILMLIAVLGFANDDQLIEAFVTAVDARLVPCLDDALDTWIKYGVLTEATDRQADLLQFDHGLMRDVILDDIPSRKLRRLHKSAAITKRDHFYPFLQGVAHDIAEHYREAGELDQSAEYRLLAARAAESAGNFNEAASHFESLLALYRERAATMSEESGVMPVGRTKSGLLKISIDWSEVWLGLGRIAIARGDYDAATEYVQELSRFAEDRGLMLPMAKSNWLLGRIASRRGMLVDAWDYFGTARDLFEAEEDMVGVAQCLWGIGQVAQRSGWLNEARAWLDEARTIYESADRPIDVAACLVAIGATAFAGGLLGEAREHYELARATFEGAQDRYNVTYCLLGLARVELAAGDRTAATTLVEEALTAFVQLGDRHGQVDCLNLLGECYLLDGQLDTAREHLAEANTGYRMLHDRHGQGHNLRLQARLLRLSGSPTEAVQFLGQALDQLSEAGDRQGQAACYLEMARIALDLEDAKRASDHLTEAHELYTISSDAIGIGTCAEVFAAICVLDGDLEQALSSAEEGRSVAQATGAVPLVARLTVVSLLPAAKALRLADVRRFAHELDALDFDIVNICEPQVVASIRATVDCLSNGEGIDPDLRGFGHRLGTELERFAERYAFALSDSASANHR